MHLRIDMRITIGLLALLISGFSFADTEVVKNFDELWAQLYQNSFQQKAVVQEKEANQLSLDRAKRHWLPRAYVSGQWFSTNDPTQVFFNNLGQRAIEQADFIPNELNNPSRSQYRFATLGLDLPLYEGGMKENQKSLFSTLVKASELEMAAKKTEEYAELGRQYGGLLMNSQYSIQLLELQNGLKKIISNYQVGSQSNPVGYSGLLGLKGVNNRIEGLLHEVNMKIENSKKWITVKTDVNTSWKPDLDENLNAFLTRHLTQTSASPFSSLLMAQEMKAETLEYMKDMEKARYLPRIGLFAQGNLYDGSRDSSTSQTYGLYLMWDLFNSDSYGRVGEAQAKAMVAESKIKAGKQDEKIMLDQLQEAKTTLEKNLELLTDSEKLLKEQTLNSMKLFRSGMLSALQLAEVINRRVDLIQDKNKAEGEYLNIYSRIYQINN